MNQVINQDCRKFLSETWCKFDFVFADPPFNIGRKYDIHDDRISPEGYRTFTLDWIDLCWKALKPGAAMMIHGSPRVQYVFADVLNELNLIDHFEQELVWSFGFGQCTFTKFIETHCRAIVLRKPGQRKFYVSQVLTESKRLLMGDPRCQTSEYKGYIPFGTVWGMDDVDGVIVEPITAQPNWGRVQGNNKERRSLHDNQLPERYLERAILAYTKENDFVFDPFGGSGTTSVVAKHLNRHSLTTEVSPNYCESIRQRLELGTVSL